MGRIQKILTHVQSASKDSQVFFLVQLYKELSAKDAVFDYYRSFPHVGGRLYYAGSEDAVQLFTLSDIICHIALTPYLLPDRTPCVHALPLDRVSSSGMHNLYQ